MVYALGQGYMRLNEQLRAGVEADVEEVCERMGVPVNAVMPSDTLTEIVQRAILYKQCQRMAEENRR